MNLHSKKNKKEEKEKEFKGYIHIHMYNCID